MHKVLIVDDEKMIREGMRRGLCWQDMNVSRVFLAQNAGEALEIIGREQPDLMITDINMPEMTGLELIERANALSKRMKIIVLTGYDRFDYARQCIRMQVEDLLLKPIEEEVLTAAICKQIRILEEEQRQQSMESTLRRVRGNTEQMRLERLMRALVRREETEREELEWMYQEYSFDPQQMMQLVILVPQLSDHNDEFHRMSIHNICNDLVDRQRKGITFQDGENVAIAFFDHGYVNEIYEHIQELTGILKDEFGRAPRVVIGSGVEGFEQLFISWNDTRYLIRENQKVGLDIMQSHSTGKRSQLFQAIFEEFKSSMSSQVGDPEQVLHVFGSFCKACDAYNLTDSKVRRCCFELASTVYFAYMSSTADETNGKLEELMRGIMHAESQDAREVTKMFLTQMFGREKEAGHDIIFEVRRYIEERLEEELSVSRIAEEFYITPNYLSKLFKRVMGEGCNEYIVGKRIEKARFLLETTNMKTGKIAMLVGYRDTNYFSLAFKKHTGYSPTLYRNHQREKKPCK